MMEGAQEPRAIPTESQSSPTNAEMIAASSLRWSTHFGEGFTAGRTADGGRSAGRLGWVGTGGDEAPVMAARTFCLSIPASESGLTDRIVPRPYFFWGMRSFPQPGLPHLAGVRVVISGCSGQV